MRELSVVGKSVLRLDAVEKALGTASFFSDIQLPGMLHMKVLRSPHPHARIVTIDTSAARQVPGVKCVVTNQDAPQKRWGTAKIDDQTVLARDVVRYVGEPVAAVAAETSESADDALGLIKVEYEELPAVFDPEEAMSTNPSVVVHPEFYSYHGVDKAKVDSSRPNVNSYIRIRKGDVEQGFAEADLVLENRFSTPAIQHCSLEPHGVVVQPEADGGLTFFTGRQGLWNLKGVVADLYKIKPSKVRVTQKYLGGGFGAKMLNMEVIAALLVLKTGRPIKWLLSREEEFVDGGHREPMIVYIKDGVKKDGTLVAREMKVITDAGAYEKYITIVTNNSSYGGGATYRIPNLKWDSYGVYTNEPPSCAFRGFGVTEIVFAVESQMDMLAEKLGMDRIELRRKNILKEGEPNIRGEITHSIGIEECLDKVIDEIGLGEKTPPDGPWHFGKGIGIGAKYSTGLAVCQAKVQVTEDEGIVIYHSADELGQGCNTVLAQIAAEEFGVGIEDVRVVFSDTAITPYLAEGSTSSRITFQVGNAIRVACNDAKRGLFQRAANRLGVTADRLDFRCKEIYVKDQPERKIRIGELFTPYRGRPANIYGGVAEGGEIIGTSTRIQEFLTEDPETGQIDPIQAQAGKAINSHYTHIAKAVEVAVNVETGEVRMQRCIAATDVGKMINPKMCEQQSESGIAMGLGAAIYEELKTVNGVPRNTNFHDYRIPSAGDVPRIADMKSLFVESAPHKNGPFGAKGLGEGVMIGMEPAIANAVYDAIGVRIKDMPVTPEKILDAMKAKRGE